MGTKRWYIGHMRSAVNCARKYDTTATLQKISEICMDYETILHVIIFVDV